MTDACVGCLAGYHCHTPRCSRCSEPAVHRLKLYSATEGAHIRLACVACYGETVNGAQVLNRGPAKPS